MLETLIRSARKNPAGSSDVKVKKRSFVFGNKTVMARYAGKIKWEGGHYWDVYSANNVRGDSSDEYVMVPRINHRKPVYISGNSPQTDLRLLRELRDLGGRR